MPNSDRTSGFTLIELMIVVAIIAIIAAIAIPSLMGARITANEGSAIASLRTLTSVNEQYRARFGLYSSSLAELGTLNYLDNVLSSGVKSGYDFVNYAGDTTGWSVQANPATPGRTGNRYFFSDESGVIRFETSGVAGATDPPID